ncbi:MAG: hypothetical protein ACYDCP_07070 [Thermoplasmataceae archaeon]
MSDKKIITDLGDPKVKAIVEKAAHAEAQTAMHAAMARHGVLIARKVDVELELTGFSPQAQAGILVSILASKIAEHGLNAAEIESNLRQSVTRSRRFQEQQKKTGAPLQVVGETIPDPLPDDASEAEPASAPPSAPPATP